MTISSALALLEDTFRRRRRLLSIAWAAAAFLPAFYLALFPSMESLLEGFSDLPEAMEAVIGDVDLATAEGFFATEVLAITGPMLVAAIAISLGTALAGSEHDGTLAPVFFSPVPRWQLAVTTLTSMVLGVAVSCLLMGAAALVAGSVIGIALPASAIVNGMIPLLGLGLFTGSLAFAASAATGSPGVGRGVAWGGLLGALVINSAGQLIAGAKWLTNVSPWGWYGGGTSVVDGIDVLGSGLLWAGAIGLAAVGIVAFNRRDLRLS